MTNASRSRLTARKPPRRSRGRGLGWLYGLLIICALVYFATAGYTGRWMADHVFGPAMDSWRGATQSPPPTTPTPQAAATPTPLPTGQAVTLPGFSLHCVQAGLFSEQSNAQDYAAQLAARGGAGVIIASPEGYRVMLAAFATDGEAQAVVAQLQQEDVASTNFVLQQPDADFVVENADQIQPLLMELRRMALEWGGLAAAGELDAEIITAALATDQQKLTTLCQGLAHPALATLCQQVQADFETAKQGADAPQAARALQLKIALALMQWAQSA